MTSLLRQVALKDSDSSSGRSRTSSSTLERIFWVGNSKDSEEMNREEMDQFHPPENSM